MSEAAYNPAHPDFQRFLKRVTERAYRDGQRDLAAKVEALPSFEAYTAGGLRADVVAVNDLRALLADALAGNGAEEPSSVPVSAREGGNGQGDAR